VTVESTSDYGRIWFYLLESAGLAVQLVDAREVKNVPGRPIVRCLARLMCPNTCPSGMKIAPGEGRYARGKPPAKSELNISVQ
jgi:hypothetical protein